NTASYICRTRRRGSQFFANPLRMLGEVIWELAHKGQAQAQDEVLLFLLMHYCYQAIKFLQ
ncbi:MAG: hypothetical protein J6B34_05615, partial [Clostridia bacterium]|nr:hypothetical protein [Clostridia bacterium]